MERYNPDGWQVFSALHEFLYILISHYGLQLRHCLWNPVCPELIPPFPESLRLFHGLLSKQDIYRRNTGKSAQLMFSQDNRVLLSLFIFIVLFIQSVFYVDSY